MYGMVTIFSQHPARKIPRQGKPASVQDEGNAVGYAKPCCGSSTNATSSAKATVTDYIDDNEPGNRSPLYKQSRGRAAEPLHLPLTLDPKQSETPRSEWKTPELGTPRIQALYYIYIYI